jgi:Aconitase X swivel domain
MLRVQGDALNRALAQHHCRLRLPANTSQHGALHRQRRRGEDCLMAVRPQVPQGHRLGGDRHRVGRARQFLALRSGSHRREILPARHKLYGQSYLDKILVLQTAKGGVASAGMLREMAARDKSPKTIIFDRANTILAQRAAFDLGGPFRGRRSHGPHPHRL